jgi:hypothetical protein
MRQEAIGGVQRCPEVSRRGPKGSILGVQIGHSEGSPGYPPTRGPSPPGDVSSIQAIPLLRTSRYTGCNTSLISWISLVPRSPNTSKSGVSTPPNHGFSTFEHFRPVWPDPPKRGLHPEVTKRCSYRPTNDTLFRGSKRGPF